MPHDGYYKPGDYSYDWDHKDGHEVCMCTM